MGVTESPGPLRLFFPQHIWAHIPDVNSGGTADRAECEAWPWVGG